VSGFNRGKLFYLRYQRGPLNTRGFSLAWDPVYDHVFSKLSIAISNSLAIDPLGLPAPPVDEIVSASPPEPGMGGPYIPAPDGDDPDIAIVREEPEPSASRISSGTGFFITTSGHLATNHHVVEDCARYAHCYEHRLD
jgi:S1-C subfamily serine protease